MNEATRTSGPSASGSWEVTFPPRCLRIHRYIPPAHRVFTFMLGRFLSSGAKPPSPRSSSGIPGFICSWSPQRECVSGARNGGWGRWSCSWTIADHPWQAIVGKFIASWLFLILALFLTSPWPMTVATLASRRRSDLRRVCGQRSPRWRLPVRDLPHLGHDPQPGHQFHPLRGSSASFSSSQAGSRSPISWCAGRSQLRRPGGLLQRHAHFSSFERGAHGLRDFIFFFQ